VSLGLGYGYWPGYYYPSYYYSSYASDPLLYYYPENVYVVPNGYSYPLSNGLSNGSIRSIMPRATGPEETLPVPQPLPNDGTYPYDGGPANPVPLPQAEPAPTRKGGSTPAPARVVGIESKAPKYSYQAYGDKPAARKAVPDRQLAAKPAK
jgi:hypothetical protein